MKLGVEESRTLQNVTASNELRQTDEADRMNDAPLHGDCCDEGARNTEA